MTHEIENTEATVNAKYKVTPAQKRVISIRISDIANNMNHSDPVREQEDYARIGKLQMMALGVIEYTLDAQEFKSVPLREKSDEKLYTAFFHGDVRDMREIKFCLMRSLSLQHFPHAMRVNKSDKNDTRRHFSVRDVTKAAAHKVLEMNPKLFTGVTFSDENRDESGVKVEE